MQKTAIALPLLSLLVAGSALAEVPRVVNGALAAAPQDEDELLDEELDEGEGEGTVESDKVGEKPAEGEVDYGGADVGESVGGATGFVRHSGFYTSSDLGGFLRFGGFTTGEGCSHPAAPCVPRISSNLQPWIKLGVGYDVVSLESFQFSTQLSLGTGFVANAAPIQDALDSPRDYAVSMINIELIGTYFIERIGISGKLFGGGAFLTPTPLPDLGAAGGVVGGGLGISWATLLTDVTIGLDVNGMYVIAADPRASFPALSFAPVIKYTF